MNQDEINTDVAAAGTAAASAAASAVCIHYVVREGRSSVVHADLPLPSVGPWNGTLRASISQMRH